MTPTRPPRPCLLVLAPLLVLSAGCATTLRIHVDSTPQTNNGQILYMMARALDEGETLFNGDYEDASRQVFLAAKKEPEDKKVQAILPGTPVVVSMPRPAAQKQLVLYFFFSNPGKYWMTPIDQVSPTEVYVKLGARNIQELTVQRQ